MFKEREISKGGPEKLVCLLFSFHEATVGEQGQCRPFRGSSYNKGTMRIYKSARFINMSRFNREEMFASLFI